MEMVAHDLAEAIGAEAGMEIDEGGAAYCLGMRRQDLMQGAVGPGLSRAAIEDAFVIPILAGGDGGLQGGGTMLGGIFGKARLVAAFTFFRPLCRADRVAQFTVAEILGLRFGVIDEVAIEIDIVFVD